MKAKEDKVKRGIVFYLYDFHHFLFDATLRLTMRGG